MPQALSGDPFAYVRQLVQGPCLPKSAERYHVVSTIEFATRHLRWIPHALSQDENHVQVEMSKTFLRHVCSAKHNAWRNFVTPDESWFYDDADYKSVWLSGDEKRPETERKTMTSPRLMLTIVENSAGFHFVDVLPKDVPFCSAFDLFHVMNPMWAAFRPDQQLPFRKFVIHADNPRVRTSQMVDEYFESQRLGRAGHPPYAPDPAPSDCFLFGFVLGRLIGAHFLDG
jgi:hypothetical protein